MSYFDILTEVKHVLMSANNGTNVFISKFETADLDSFAGEAGVDTAAASTEQANTGTYSAKVVEADSTFLGIERAASLTSGRTYRLEAYVYTASTLSDVRIIEAQGGNAASPLIQNEWHKLAVQFTASATASVNFRCQVRNGATAYFDDVRVDDYQSLTPNPMGQVYGRVRRLTDTERRKVFFVDNNKFHVWMVTRPSMEAIQVTTGSDIDREHVFRLIGYYQFDDANESENTFQKLVDLVLNKMDTSSNLQFNNTSTQLKAAELVSFEHTTLFHDVVCHEAIIDVFPREVVSP